LSAINAPVYGFYGGNDARITAGVPATTDGMKQAGKKYDPVTYEGAGHGFMRSGEDPAGTMSRNQQLSAADCADGHGSEIKRSGDHEQWQIVGSTLARNLSARF
jgi:dienelactone hydrolase